MPRIYFTTYGRNLGRLTVPRYAQPRDGTAGIEAVINALERANRGLYVCGGPRWDGADLERGREVAQHYQMTLGHPCRGGGYTPIAEVWVSIPTG